MAFSVETNIASLNTQRNLQGNANSLAVSLQRLSTGTRINSAKDDAAGLQISNRLTSQINGLNIAAKNANDGISIAQTAEGALEQSTSTLQRMRDLALQSANGSNSSAERSALNAEVQELKKELDRIANTTTFGGRKLLDGSFGTATFQVGSAANETISASIGEMSTQALDGKVFKHAFKFSDLGLDLGEETALKNVSWNPGRPHRPAEGDYLIDNPNYDPNDSSFGPEQIINPDYISEILEVKAQGTYEVDLKVPLTINGNTFSFSLGSQSPTGRYLNQPGGSSAPDDLKVKDLAPTYRNSILSKLDEIFEKPDQILQEMATNINELNIGVGAFVEVVDDEYQLTLIADGSKDIPELKIQDTAIEMETIVQTAAEIDLTDDKLAQKCCDCYRSGHQQHRQSASPARCFTESL